MPVASGSVIVLLLPVGVTAASVVPKESIPVSNIRFEPFNVILFVVILPVSVTACKVVFAATANAAVLATNLISPFKTSKSLLKFTKLLTPDVSLNTIASVADGTPKLGSASPSDKKLCLSADTSLGDVTFVLPLK